MLAIKHRHCDVSQVPRPRLPECRHRVRCQVPAIRVESRCMFGWLCTSYRRGLRPSQCLAETRVEGSAPGDAILLNLPNFSTMPMSACSIHE